MSTQSDRIIASLKLAAASGREPISHCQKLDRYSRELGFQSFFDLKKTLGNTPEVILERSFAGILLEITRLRSPRPGLKYYGGVLGRGLDVLFSSRWVGFDSNRKEIREPAAFSDEDLNWIAEGNGAYGHYKLHIIEMGHEIAALAKQCDILVMFNESVLRAVHWPGFERAPIENTWDSFFTSKPNLTDDFMEERAVRIKSAKRLAALGGAAPQVSDVSRHRTESEG